MQVERRDGASHQAVLADLVVEEGDLHRAGRRVDALAVEAGGDGALAGAGAREVVDQATVGVVQEIGVRVEEVEGEEAAGVEVCLDAVEHPALRVGRGEVHEAVEGDEGEAEAVVGREGLRIGLDQSHAL